MFGSGGSRPVSRMRWWRARNVRGLSRAAASGVSGLKVQGSGIRAPGDGLNTLSGGQGAFWPRLAVCILTLRTPHDEALSCGAPPPAAARRALQPDAGRGAIRGPGAGTAAGARLLWARVPGHVGGQPRGRQGVFHPLPSLCNCWTSAPTLPATNHSGCGVLFFTSGVVVRFQ